MPTERVWARSRLASLAGDPRCGAAHRLAGCFFSGAVSPVLWDARKEQGRELASCRGLRLDSRPNTGKVEACCEICGCLHLKHVLADGPLDPRRDSHIVSHVGFLSGGCRGTALVSARVVAPPPACCGQYWMDACVSGSCSSRQSSLKIWLCRSLSPLKLVAVAFLGAGAAGHTECRPAV